MTVETQQLVDYIGAVKSEGASDEFVVALLRQNGWSEKRIYPAFAAWYETRTGRTVPNGGGRIEAARDAFLYLLAFFTLGIWAIQMGALLFTAIDRTLPNPAVDYANAAYVTHTLADELASVLVGFPLFLLVTWAILRGAQRQPERLESPVRKWLTYIALVITAGTMIGDLVTFLAYLLRGDLDSRFVLKVITVLVIAGGVFAYYLDSLRRDKVSFAHHRAFALGALAAVVFAVIVGFGQIGAPAVQREQALDARRLFDLSSLAQTLHGEWIGHHERFVVPSAVQALQGAQNGASIFDPATGWIYRYEPLQGTTYRLCATFSRSSPHDVPAEWQHAAGQVCFNLDARDNVAFVARRW
jgi:hypothetical protein